MDLKAWRFDLLLYICSVLVIASLIPTIASQSALFAVEEPQHPTPPLSQNQPTNDPPPPPSPPQKTKTNPRPNQPAAERERGLVQRKLTKLITPTKAAVAERRRPKVIRNRNQEGAAFSRRRGGGPMSYSKSGV